MDADDQDSSESNGDTNIDGLFQKIQDALASLSNSLGDSAVEDFAHAMEIFQTGFQEIDIITKDIYHLMQALLNEDPIVFDDLGDNFHDKEDTLHSALDHIGNNMDLLREEMENSGDSLSADMRDISDQVQVIADLMADALDDARDKEAEDIWNDVSEETINNITRVSTQVGWKAI